MTDDGYLHILIYGKTLKFYLTSVSLLCSLWRFPNYLATNILLLSACRHSFSGGTAAF